MEDKTGLNSFDDHVKDVVSKLKNRCENEMFDHHQYGFIPIEEKIQRPGFEGEIKLSCIKPSKEVEPNDKVRWLKLEAFKSNGAKSECVFRSGDKDKIVKELGNESFVEDVKRIVDGAIGQLESKGY